MAEVIAVCSSPRHAFSKDAQPSIRLEAGVGVVGDAHAGATVKHRSRVRANPNQPNLRQVHLIHAELLDELNGRGFDVAAGELGENITTRRLDILALGQGALLRLGAEAIVEVTGLRNPCSQLDALQSGLMEAVLERRPDGGLIRKCGIMGVVRVSGEVRPGDAIAVTPPREHRPLQPV